MLKYISIIRIPCISASEHYSLSLTLLGNIKMVKHLTVNLGINLRILFKILSLTLYYIFLQYMQCFLIFSFKTYELIYLSTFSFFDLTSYWVLWAQIFYFKELYILIIRFFHYPVLLILVFLSPPIKHKNMCYNGWCVTTVWLLS